MTPSPPTPVAPDFKVVVCTAEIDRPLDAAWTAIGGYADAGRFLNIASKLISGDGGLGSVRLIGDAILEVMVGRSSHSYAYAQTRGPMAQYAYHGCVALEQNGSASCKLTYSLMYDQSTLDETSRASQIDRITNRFGGAVKAMKQDAESRS
jgi:hypothetical protein